VPVGGAAEVREGAPDFEAEVHWRSISVIQLSHSARIKETGGRGQRTNPTTGATHSCMTIRFALLARGVHGQRDQDNLRFKITSTLLRFTEVFLVMERATKAKKRHSRNTNEIRHIQIHARKMRVVYDSLSQRTRNVLQMMPTTQMAGRSVSCECDNGKIREGQTRTRGDDHVLEG
jgi:hypothetical protein